MPYLITGTKAFHFAMALFCSVGMLKALWNQLEPLHLFYSPLTLGGCLLRARAWTIWTISQCVWDSMWYFSSIFLSNWAPQSRFGGLKDPALLFCRWCGHICFTEQRCAVHWEDICSQAWGSWAIICTFKGHGSYLEKGGLPTEGQRCCPKQRVWVSWGLAHRWGGKQGGTWQMDQCEYCTGLLWWRAKALNLPVHLHTKPPLVTISG